MEFNRFDFEQQLKSCTHPVQEPLLRDAQNLLHERHNINLKPGEMIQLQARQGEIAWLQCVLGTPKRGHVFEMIHEKADLYLLLDYLDAILYEFFSKKRQVWLPLDYALLYFEKSAIYVRQEECDFTALELAEEFLKKHDKAG